MKSIFTAVLLSIACLAFAGCGIDEDDERIRTQELFDYYTSNKPNIEKRWTHRDWLEKEDALNYRIHNGRCTRWNMNWVPIPPDQANVWRRRRNAEQEKPESQWNMAAVMTDPDTGKRYRIGCWGCYGKN